MSTLPAVGTYDAHDCRIIEDDGISATHLFYSASCQVLQQQMSGQTTNWATATC